MRKIIFPRIFAASTFLLALIIGSTIAHSQAFIGANGSLLAPEMQRIQERGTLRVAVYATDREPFFYVKDGELVGTDIDLARNLAEELGVELEISRNGESFDLVVDEVALGKVDLAISKVSRTIKRSQRVAFSDPYHTFRQAVILNRVELAKIIDGRELGDFLRAYDGTLGVLANSSYAVSGRENFKLAEIVTYDDQTDLVNAVIAGDITAAYSDEFEVRKVMAKDPSLSLLLRPVGLDDLIGTIGIVVAVENTALLSFVNLFLEQKHEFLSTEDLLRIVAASR